MSTEPVLIAVDRGVALVLAHAMHVRLEVLSRDLKVMRSDDPDRGAFESAARALRAGLLATRDALDDGTREIAARYWAGLE